jgi:hypothetical protein
MGTSNPTDTILIFEWRNWGQPHKRRDIPKGELAALRVINKKHAQ